MALRRNALAAVCACLLAGWAAAPAAHAAPATRGVAVDILLHEDPSRALADIDAAADLGSTTVRVAIHWSGFEPVRGQVADWYQDRLDALVARARTRGVKVLLTPVFTPAWATRSGTQATPPDDAADYGRHVAYLAARYGTDLAGIEIWNEPNLASFWSTDDPATRYVDLVKAASRAMDEVAPHVPVVAGAVAGGEAGFLGALYAAGIQGHYDVLSVHVYNDGRAPEALIDPRWAHATFLQGLRALRETLTTHGETRPVWITEMGWNTSTLRGALWLDGVDLDQQADYLARALAMLEDPTAGIDFTSGVLVYRLRDLGDDPADPQHNYGLQSRDGTPKPSLAAVRDAFRAPAPEPAAEPGATGPAPVAPAPVAPAPVAPAPVAPAPVALPVALPVAPVPLPVAPVAPVTEEPTSRAPTTTRARSRKPKLRITRVRTSPRLRLAGTATRTGTRKVRRVEVALVRLDRRGRCRRSDGARTRRLSSCRPGRYKRARGTRKWSYRAGRTLSRGRYVAHVRAVDSAGARSVVRRTLRAR